MEAISAPKVSIIIVSYNTKAMTLDCIRSIGEQTKRSSYEIIVFDNASVDGSADEIAARFPGLRLIASATNIGFAAATNEAARMAQGDYFLLLNPDTVILDGAIDKLVSRADASPGNYGAWGGRTLYGDGTLNHTSGWNKTTLWSMTCLGFGLSALFRRSRIFNPESLESWSWDAPRDIDVITGCFFLIRADLWRRLRGFDSRFFMYGEDADLSLRIWEAGYRCELFPDATIIHYDGASEHCLADRRCRILAAQAMTYRAHMSRLSAEYSVVMLFLWVFSRLIASVALSPFSKRGREAMRTWRSIIKRTPIWANGIIIEK